MSPLTIDHLTSEAKRRHPGRHGEVLAAFLELFHARTPANYLSRFSADAHLAAAAENLRFLESNQGPEFSIRIFNPPWLAPAGGEARTAIQVTGPDQSFLVDTLRELVRVHGHPTLDLFHPILSVERDAAGKITRVAPPDHGGPLVSFMSLETRSLNPGTQLDALLAEAREVFTQARKVVQDFQAMVARVYDVAGRLRSESIGTSDPRRREETDEAFLFLEWLLRSNFVFLGYREYTVSYGPEGPELGIVRGSGLGILAAEERSTVFQPRRLSSFPPEFQKRALQPRILTVHKTNSESRVLRRTRMDYVGVKRLDREGKVVGEQRFLGLFTPRALGDLPSDIPVLAHKLDKILALSRVVPGSHDHKEIFSIYCSLPKSELFVTDVEDLHSLVLGILESRDRHDVRVLYRNDTLERGVSAMVLLPRHRFSLQTRLAIQQLLEREFHGTLVDYQLALTDEPLARLHFYFATPPGSTATPPLGRLERRVAAITRSWEERFTEAVRRRHGVQEGDELARRYAKAFPSYYAARERPDEAAEDVVHVEEVLRSGGPLVRLSRLRIREAKGSAKLKIFRRGEEFLLSHLMPPLSHFGLEVRDEVTYGIAAPDRDAVHLHSFRVLGPGGKPLDVDAVQDRLQEAVRRVLDGDLLDDRLNTLVVTAGLDGRQVDVLRAYTAYFQQLEGTLRQRTAYSVLVDNPAAARALVGLFELRFDPDLPPAERDARLQAQRREFAATLESATGIVEDQVLRGLANLIEATVRTNHSQGLLASGAPRALAFKVRSGDVARMPLPRPLFEVFVFSAGMEGIHLRSGKVARGGIRSSERIDDYRTEVLGLMKAQRTKNAVIVPVGAKGGFVLHQTPAAEAGAQDVRRHYEAFIAALLDITDNITDNITGGRTVHPPRTLVYDDEDPYLVVAADKGTASFSDFANDIAESRSFWLGNAFASGGSKGYNHKAYGITAKGAWECVQNHFHGLGVDIERETITVAGIGDMSGDVFGNGMLQSRRIRLLAAFNHKHVFIDPDPDLEVSFAERRRLFELPHSSWEAYDRSKLSPGGGIWSRSAKSIRLSPEARARLGIDKEAVNGDELVRAVLTMDVDLLFNGGIGTYIKAESESDLQAGDRSNDAVRVNARDVKARVIAEGGNLGVTQRGRIEFARKGGRINTDFIDNSGGVDLSDHEVNLKILLNEAAGRGALSPDDGVELLRSVAGEVCAHVLADNRQQAFVLSLDESRCATQIDQFRFVLDELEAGGLLQRAIEHLPQDGEIVKLRETGLGLTRPELAVVLAYVKIDAYTKVVESPLARGAALDALLGSYFPRSIVERLAAQVGSHRLRREIAATVAVNRCVNRMGATFLHRLVRDTGTSMGEVLESCLLASALLDTEGFHRAVEAAAPSTPLAVLVEAAGIHAAHCEALARWCLRRRLTLTSIEDLRRLLAEGLQALEGAGRGFEVRFFEALQPSLPRLPTEQVQSLVRTQAAVDALEGAELAQQAGRPVTEAAAALAQADERLLLGRVREEAARIAKSSASDWQMCAQLLDELRDLRRDLGTRVLACLAPTGGGLDAAAAGDGLRAMAREAAVRIVADEHPSRRRVLADLERLGSRAPPSPSSLFVVVEELRKLVGPEEKSTVDSRRLTVDS